MCDIYRLRLWCVWRKLKAVMLAKMYKMSITRGDYMADWNKAKATAQEILEKYKFKEPFIDVFKIAKDEGIEIVPIEPEQDQRQFSGFLDKNGDKPKIYVNATEDVRRQTWTVAHELGHYFLKHEPDNWGINWRDQSVEEKNNYEQEADYFSACLLIPEKMLKKVMDEYKLKTEDFSLLAELFGVSPSAMKHRLSFLRF